MPAPEELATGPLRPSVRAVRGVGAPPTCERARLARGGGREGGGEPSTNQALSPKARSAAAFVPRGRVCWSSGRCAMHRGWEDRCETLSRQEHAPPLQRPRASSARLGKRSEAS